MCEIELKRVNPNSLESNVLVAGLLCYEPIIMKSERVNTLKYYLETCVYQIN